MGKKILFVGAGRFQLPGILKAKQMGLEVLAVDGDPNAPGLGVADLNAVIDVRDVQGVLDISEAHKIDAVTSIASEVSVRTVADVAFALGLPGIHPDVSRKVTDKEKMREVFRDSGIPSTEFRGINCVEEGMIAYRDLGPEVVVKPVDNAGSRGVQYVANEDKLGDAFIEALEHSISKRVLIEKYMEGAEISVEAYVHEGEITILCMSDKVRTPPPFLLDTIVLFPTCVDSVLKKQILDVAIGAIQAVGLDNAPVHIEIILTPDGPRMVEMAGRGAGFKVFTDIVPRVTGVDLVRASIKAAIGENPDLRVRRDDAAALRLLSGTPGRVISISGLSEARDVQGVAEVELYIDAGDSVRPLTNGSDRIGHIIAYASSRQEVEDVVRHCESTIEIATEKKGL